MTIEEHVKRRPDARRTRQRLNREFGRALTLRGAVKKSRLKKLAKLAGEVHAASPHGYTYPAAAGEAVRKALDIL